MDTRPATPDIASIRTSSGFQGHEKPAYDDYARCVHCGLCLDQCPTYRLWGMEADSPRGRIQQMALVDQGELPLGESFVMHIERCLDCRACETACPSGVEYGKLIELARGQIEQNYRRPLLSRILRHAAFRAVLPHPRRIAALARLLRFYQRSGAQSFVRQTGFLRLLHLDSQERLLPSIEDEFFFSRLGKTFPAAGERRARVAFFAGCIAQVAFAALNEATIRVLQANGCEVVVPDGQICCGALAAHAGVRDSARELARRNLEAFSREPVDAILTNAAGCGSTLKEYSHLFPAGADEFRSSVEFGGRVRDVTEFLAELGLSAPLHMVRARITYQDSCHLLHGQQIREAPRQLLRAIPGLEFREMPFADQCCGSAGIYNVTQTAASMAILADKMHHAAGTGAEIIATSNPGCLLQLRAGAAIHRTGQQVLHVMELLDRATSQALMGARGHAEGS